MLGMLSDGKSNILLSNVGMKDLALFCILKSLSLLLRLTLASPWMLDLILEVFSDLHSVGGNVLSQDALAFGDQFSSPVLHPCLWIKSFYQTVVSLLGKCTECV